MATKPNTKTGKHDDQFSFITKEFLIIEMYENAIKLFDSKLEDLLNKLAKSIITAEQYELQSKIYTELTDEYLAKIDALKMAKK